MHHERPQIPCSGNDQPILAELQNYVYWIALSLLPVAGAYIFGAVMSGSLSVAALTLQCTISVFANIFTLISMRAIARKNIFIFPYGTGKLENFIGFLTGTLMLPVAATIFYSTVNSFVSGNHQVRFAFTQIGMIPGLLRDLSLLLWSKKLIEKAKAPSPIVLSFYVSYKVSVSVTLTGVLSMLLALWLSTIGFGHLGILLDLILAAALATYMLVHAVILIKANFRSLIDLPLTEDEQLTIMKVVGRYYDSFDNLGAIYSRTCGSTRVVEIELYFKRTTTLEEIDELAERFRADFEKVFAAVDFRLIPMLEREGDKRSFAPAPPGV